MSLQTYIPNNRNIHTTPTPLVGGIAIIFSTLILIIIFNLYIETKIQQFIIFSLFFLFIGMFDDLFRWEYKKKLTLQILVLILFIISISSNISHLTLISIYSDYKILNYIIIFSWMLFIINAFNFFDGVNFLAGSLAIIFFSSYAIYYNSLEEIIPLILLVILIFSIIGFLVYNRAPARMFLGDSGSMFLGFAIASFPIIFQSKESITFDLTFPLIVLFIVISDTLFVIINRIIKRKSPFDPDKTHLHHQFLNLRFRNRYIVLIIITGAILHSMLAFLYSEIGLPLLFLLLIFINLLFIILPRFLPALFAKYNLWGLKNVYDYIVRHFVVK